MFVNIEAAFSPLPRWLLSGPFTPVTVSVKTFRLLSSWEVSLSCPFRFPSRCIVFDRALACRHSYTVCCTFTCPLSAGSPKFTCTASLFLQRTHMDLYLLRSLMSMQQWPELSDFLHHPYSSYCNIQLTDGSSGHAPYFNQGFRSPGNRISFGTQTALICAAVQPCPALS